MESHFEIRPMARQFCCSMKAATVAGHLDDVNVMSELADPRAGQALGPKHLDRSRCQRVIAPGNLRIPMRACTPNNLGQPRIYESAW